uniref:Putative secreted protein n=1 Tax=Anopheles marajoara TaxID=58244 RepID=A0A2M4C6D2_9DIPT
MDVWFALFLCFRIQLSAVGWLSSFLSISTSLLRPSLSSFSMLRFWRCCFRRLPRLELLFASVAAVEEPTASFSSPPPTRPDFLRDMRRVTMRLPKSVAVATDNGGVGAVAVKVVAKSRTSCSPPSVAEQADELSIFRERDTRRVTIP